MEDEDDRPLLDRDCGPVFRNLDLIFYVGSGVQEVLLEHDLRVDDLEAIQTQLNLWFNKLEDGMCILNDGNVDTRRDYRVKSYFVGIDITEQSNLLNLVQFFSAGRAMQEVASEFVRSAEIDMLQNCIIGSRIDEDGEQKPFALVFSQGRWFSPEVSSLMRMGREMLREIAQLPDID